MLRALMTRLRREDGVMLMELTIAMTVLSVALMALMATYSSGYMAVNRASVKGTAATLADTTMETYRGLPYSAITAGTTTKTYSTATTPPSPDGRTYIVTSVVAASVATNTTGTSARTVKTVSITVADSTGKTRARQKSVFDELAG
jgi:type II secretory pathway pseudopilin PulG